MHTWQRAVRSWVEKVLGTDNMKPRVRALRFAEESIELCQAADMLEEDYIKLVHRVYSKPKGEVQQEVGGVFVTFLAFCSGLEVDAYECLVTEFNRIGDPKMKAKIVASDDNKREAGL